MPTSREKPRVFIYEDSSFFSITLSEILSDAGCEPIVRTPELSLFQELKSMKPPPALIMLPLSPDPTEILTSVATLRKLPWLARTPILGISALHLDDLNLWQLRALGIVGAIDSGAIPEHVRFRVGQIVYDGREGRRHERAPCCLPVEVEIDGVARTEYAVSVSVGGMGLACEKRIDPDTNLRLRFDLEPGPERVEVEGRSVHLRRVQRDGANFQVGVLFRDPSEHVRVLLANAVADIKSAWERVNAIEGDGPWDASGRGA